jgi:NAD(P)-dependent dehydrogenase (short-subunit alcohol dehydrogenase family)
MGKLGGKVAIITGGASGIGEGSVREFIAAGAKVVIADIQDAKGEALAQEFNGNAIYVHTDVLNEDQVKNVVETTVNHFGRLDCIFNNAGVPGPGEGITDINAADFDFALNILLRGVFFGMKHAAAVMIKQKAGSIINTASIAGLQTGYAGHIYTAAKHGVIGLTKSVAMELGEYNIRVNSICPGGIATPIFGKAMGMTTEMADMTVEAAKMALEKGQPVKRAGLPQDIGKAAVWLASEDSSFVSAHSLVVDGGITGGRTWAQLQETGMTLAAVFMSQLQG